MDVSNAKGGLARARNHRLPVALQRKRAEYSGNDDQGNTTHPEPSVKLPTGILVDRLAYYIGVTVKAEAIDIADRGVWSVTCVRCICRVVDLHEPSVW